MLAADLDALLQDAQGFNQAAGVSGVLCYHDGLFIQYFEGPASAVERAYAIAPPPSRNASCNRRSAAAYLVAVGTACTS